MKKILIAAYELKHAEYYAREILQIPRSSWKFIQDDWDIRGHRGFDLHVVSAPRYIPGLLQQDHRSMIRECALAWGLNVIEGNLP